MSFGKNRLNEIVVFPPPACTTLLAVSSLVAFVVLICVVIANAAIAAVTMTMDANIIFECMMIHW
jgi:hypothetical protein